MSRIQNVVVQPGCWRPKDFLVLEVKVINIILWPINFIFFLLRRNGFFIQLPVVTFDYIPWVFATVNADPCRSPFLIINNFSQARCDLAIQTKCFHDFLSAHFDLILKTSKLSRRDLEISCEYVEEVHLSFI